MPVDVIAALDKVLDGPSPVSLKDYIDQQSGSLDKSSQQRHALASSDLKNAILRVDQRCDFLDKFFMDKFAGMEKAGRLFAEGNVAQFLAVREAQHLAKEAVDIRFVSISDGTKTATASLDKRLEGMNEFRQQMNDMSAKFITRQDVENTIKYLNDRLTAAELGLSIRITREELATQHNAMGDRVSSLEKFSNNMQGRMWVIAAVVVVMEVALRFLGK